MILFDIETDGLLDELTKVHCIAYLEVNTEGGVILKPPDLIDEGVAELKSADTLIGHNIIGFDLPAIWKVTGEWDKAPLIIDTLIFSRLLWPERPWGHGLEAWGEHLGEKKIDFHAYDEYSEEMLEYCKQDVIVNYLVFKELEKEYGKQITEGFKVY